MSQFELENFLLQQSIKALERQYPTEVIASPSEKKDVVLSEPESVSQIATTIPVIVIPEPKELPPTTIVETSSLLEVVNSQSAALSDVHNVSPIQKPLEQAVTIQKYDTATLEPAPTVLSPPPVIEKVETKQEEKVQVPNAGTVESRSEATPALAESITVITAESGPADPKQDMPSIPEPSKSNSTAPTVLEPVIIPVSAELSQLQSSSEKEPGLTSPEETQSILEAAAQKLVALSEAQQLDASDSAIQNILQTISQYTEPTTLDLKDQFLYCKDAMLKILEESLSSSQRYQKAPLLPTQIDEWRDQRVTSDISKMIAGTIRESVANMFQKHELFEIQGKELLLQTPFPPMPLSSAEIVQKCGQTLTNVYRSCFEIVKTGDALIPVIKTAVTMQAKEFTNLRPDEIAVKQAMIDDLYTEFFDEAFQSVYELLK
jgi:hypothetical protein